MLYRMSLPRLDGKRLGYLLLAVLSFGVTDRSIAQTSIPAEARAAPDFSRMDINHKPLRLATFRGKVVLLNFWATWCEPCLVEMPGFVRLQRKYKTQGLQIIGISMDDDEQPVRSAYKKFLLNYPVAMGDERLGELYGGILGLPVIFLIDGDGKIRYRHRGAADFILVENEIQGLLSKH